MNKQLRLATRQSPLALWQAEHIKQALLALAPELEITLFPLLTQGDKDTSGPLTDKGGKGLFVKELQRALLENKADFAVHSVKDMSVLNTEGLCLAAIPERADPRDAFVSLKFARLDELPNNARVGTSSPRRTALLKAYRPDLNIEILRGNVQTRLNKLAAGNYDAIILAAAGLQRLGLAESIRELLSTDSFIPAIGQGALGIECRSNDAELIRLLHQLNHETSYGCVSAERAVNKRLGGSCYVPIAAHAHIEKGILNLRGMVASLDGNLVFKAEISGEAENAEALGLALAEKLLAQGAQQVLDLFNI